MKEKGIRIKDEWIGPILKADEKDLKKLIGKMLHYHKSRNNEASK